MTTLIAAGKFAQFLFWCAVLIPPQAILMIFDKGSPAYTLPQLWHKMICRAFGLDVEVVGQPVTGQQALYVSNHISYLDISVISCVIPVSFVAKAEVAGWPLFGLLAKLQQTVFISRSRQDLQKEQDKLRAILKDGKSLVIFPEGTSSDGSQVLPFKSSLFSMALEDGSQNMVIQPFTIELTEADGKKAASQTERDMYAWYGDMTLMPHFWNFAKLRGAKVKLHFHAPVRVKEGESRKDLALKCYQMVAGTPGQDMAEAA